MKYPIGIQTFAEIIDKGYVYIDKTGLRVVILVDEAEICGITEQEIRKNLDNEVEGMAESG